jgi:DHA1 family bicyclomycin/chloramphenicol resistance-like MFS transporter
VRAGAFVLSGFLISLTGAAYAVVYRLVVPEPSLWGVVLPLAAGALGVALVFPILTTDLLDLRPRERGSVSSFQAFSSTCLNAVVAGVVSPLVSASLLVLAVVAGAFTAVALALWTWHRRIVRRDRLRVGPVELERSVPLGRVDPPRGA